MSVVAVLRSTHQQCYTGHLAFVQHPSTPLWPDGTVPCAVNKHLQLHVYSLGLPQQQLVCV